MKIKAVALCFLPVALAAFAEKHNCEWCDNVNVPFPFWLNESCPQNSDLVLSCNRTSGNLYLYPNVPVYDISVEDGTMIIGVYRALDCYDENGHRLDGSNPDPSVQLGPQFTLSDTRNKLTVFGCDTYAYFSDSRATFWTGCLSYCHEDDDFMAESACSGLGCCQTSIPKNLSSLNISMASFRNYTSSGNSSPCGSAFVVDQESFNVSNYKLPLPADLGKNVFSRVVLDWVVERDLTCAEAQSNKSSYLCGTNANCSDFKNGKGYRCFCKPGYTGNPYAASPLSPGCEDINECKDPGRYPCHGKCKNTHGNYTCDCPFGMTGDGKIGCTPLLVKIAAAVAATMLCCVIMSGLVLFIRKRIAKERYFRQNGGKILRHQRVKIFTEAELAKATNNYDASNKLGEGGFASVHRGLIDGNVLVAVKKPRDVPVRKPKDATTSTSV